MRFWCGIAACRFSVLGFTPFGLENCFLQGLTDLVCPCAWLVYALVRFLADAPRRWWKLDKFLISKSASKAPPLEFLQRSFHIFISSTKKHDVHTMFTGSHGSSPRILCEGIPLSDLRSDVPTALGANFPTDLCQIARCTSPRPWEFLKSLALQRSFELILLILYEFPYLISCRSLIEGLVP